jgi:hypothetical protein
VPEDLLHVVPDTNAFYKQDLDSPSLAPLMKAASERQLVLVLTRPVRLEWERHHVDRAVGVVRKLRSAGKSYDAVAAQLRLPSRNETEALATIDEDGIRGLVAGTVERWVADSPGVESLPAPSVEHEALLRRDTERRKPFQVSGKGYRDALTWESVLQLLRNGSRVLLVTSDSDFLADSGDGLDPDLLAEVEAAGGRDRFSVCAALAEVETPEQPFLALDSDEVSAIRQAAHEFVRDRLLGVQPGADLDDFPVRVPVREVEMAEQPFVRGNRRTEAGGVEGVAVVKVTAWVYGELDDSVLDHPPAGDRFRPIRRLVGRGTVWGLVGVPLIATVDGVFDPETPSDSDIRIEHIASAWHERVG